MARLIAASASGASTTQKRSPDLPIRFTCQHGGSFDVMGFIAALQDKRGHESSRESPSLGPQSPGALCAERESAMDSTTLLVIILLIVLLGGGGYYGRGRWW